jgi:predicted enzyme related to lactoylglutathione lyase
MGQPVVHFETIGADPERLRDYYGELFGWEFDTSGGVAVSPTPPSPVHGQKRRSSSSAVGRPPPTPPSRSVRPSEPKAERTRRRGGDAVDNHETRPASLRVRGTRIFASQESDYQQIASGSIHVPPSNTRRQIEQVGNVRPREMFMRR